MFRRLGRMNRRHPGSQSAGGGGGAFTPASLSNLAAWWRADLGVTGGASPTAWADQSGKGVNLSGGGPALTWSATAGPNSTAAMAFAANVALSAMQSGTGHPATGNTFAIWLVHKFTGNTTYYPFVLGNVTKMQAGIANGAFPIRTMTLGANSQGDGNASTAAFEAWLYIQNAGTQTLYVNGSTVGLSGNIAAVTPDANVSIQNAVATTDYLLCEGGVINAVPSAGDITNLNAYFTTRYGL